MLYKNQTQQKQSPKKNPNTNIAFKGWFVNGVLTALGVVIAAHTSGAIDYDSGAALAVAAILLSVFNSILKPILIVAALPFVVLSMGLGLWFINALLLMLVANLVSGFEVESFGAALWGAFVISMTTLFIGGLLKGKVTFQANSLGRGPKRPQQRQDDDVIDI